MRHRWFGRAASGIAMSIALGAFAGCSAPNDGGDTGANTDASRDVVHHNDVQPIDVQGNTDTGPVIPVTDQVDFLLEVDNSNSMQENQAQIMSQLGPLIDGLTNPPCTSTSNSTPHACNATDPMDHQLFPPVHDMHVGVISQDLGTPGSTVIGCANSAAGDDGLLNPIHYGQALATHLPTPGSPTAAPAGFRPPECTDPNQFPAFISFDSTTNVANFERDFRCNAGLYVNGCGLEQQLEAVYRALVVHDARERPGNTDPNAGFIRDGSLLAIVVLSDEEDMSVRADAHSVFDTNSTAWGATSLNMRSYVYVPGSPQDPTFSIDRYVNPRDLSMGLMALKPGHPERIIFAAITGIPLSLSTTSTGATDWNSLLGTPGSDPDNFIMRNAMSAVSMMSREGLVSMRQPNPDPHCTDRVVPACRREGQLDDPTNPSCTTQQQYFAWPARRIVEVARRFDESHLCNGAPCHNGLVCSICAADFGPCVINLARRIGPRVQPPG